MKSRNPGKSIKFDSDYDFEQANNKFEELRTQLAKLKVGDNNSDGKTEQQVVVFLFHFSFLFFVWLVGVVLWWWW